MVAVAVNKTLLLLLDRLVTKNIDRLIPLEAFYERDPTIFKPLRTLLLLAAKL